MMLVEGLDTAAMVQRLGVSRTTVRTHLQAVLTKLGVHSRLEAASFAVRHRLPELWFSGEGLQTAGTPAARAASGTPAARGSARPAFPWRGPRARCGPSGHTRWPTWKRKRRTSPWPWRAVRA